MIKAVCTGYVTRIDRLRKPSGNSNYPALVKARIWALDKLYFEDLRKMRTGFDDQSLLVSVFLLLLEQ